MNMIARAATWIALRGTSAVAAGMALWVTSWFAPTVSAAGEQKLHWQAPSDQVRVVQRVGEVAFLGITSPGQNYDELRYDVKIAASEGRTYLHADVRMSPERHDRVTAPYVRLLTTNFEEFAMLVMTNAALWSTGEVLSRSMRLQGLPGRYYVACGFAGYFDAMYPHMQTGPRESVFDAQTGRIIYRGALKTTHNYTVKVDQKTGVMFLGDTLNVRVLDAERTAPTTDVTAVNLDYEIYNIETGQRVARGADVLEVVLRAKVMGNYLVHMSVGVDPLVHWRAMRQVVVLPALEWTDDPEYLGRMVVNDAVACGLAGEQHVYEDGRIDDALGTEVVSERFSGSAITSVWGVTGRVVTHDRGFFGYTLGANLQWNMPYVIEIKYPEDLPRTYAFVVGSGVYAPGIHTGHTLAQPEPRFFSEEIPFPLSQDVRSAQFIVWAGDEEVHRGFFVGVADPGTRNAPYSHKPLIFNITLYRLHTIARLKPRHAVPPDLQRYAWVESQEALPLDNVLFSPHVNAVFYGLNALAPGALAWNGHADRNRIVMFPSRRYIQPRRQIIGMTEYTTDANEDPAYHYNFMGACAALARQLQLKVFPRFEYGGSDLLPRDARAVNADGTPYLAQRATATGPVVDDAVDLCHPDVLADACAVVRELTAAVDPDDKGVLDALIVRRRADFLSTSFSAPALAQFARETGTRLAGDTSDEQRRDVVAEHLGAYRCWYQQRLLTFVSTLQTTYQSALTQRTLPLQYYHWRTWGMPFEGVYFQTAAAWQNKWRNIRRLPIEGFPLLPITSSQLVAAVSAWTTTEEGLCTNLLPRRDMTITVPVYGKAAADSTAYIEACGARGGSIKITAPLTSSARIARKQREPIFAGQTMYHSSQFSMYEPLLAFSTANPRCLAFDQTHQACFPFPRYTRRFLGNFLALPAIPMEPVPQRQPSPLHVVYGTLENRTYVAIMNPSFGGVRESVFVPVQHAQTVVPLLGKTPELPFFVNDKGISFDVTLDALELYSVCVEH
jgi:hypothetical protein